MTHVSTSFTHHAVTTIGVIRSATSRAAHGTANIGIRGVHRSRVALADGLELLAARIRPKTKQPKLIVSRTEKAPAKKRPAVTTRKRVSKKAAEKKPTTPAAPAQPEAGKVVDLPTPAGLNTATA